MGGGGPVPGGRHHHRAFQRLGWDRGKVAFLCGRRGGQPLPEVAGHAVAGLASAGARGCGRGVIGGPSRGARRGQRPITAVCAAALACTAAVASGLDASAIHLTVAVSARCWDMRCHGRCPGKQLLLGGPSSITTGCGLLFWLLLLVRLPGPMICTRCRRLRQPKRRGALRMSREGRTAAAAAGATTVGGARGHSLVADPRSLCGLMTLMPLE